MMTGVDKITHARQTTLGLGLAALVIGAWLAIHVTAVFVLPLSGTWLLAAPLVVAVQTVLSVGLFIIAHDGMHGSIAPFRPALNKRIAAFCLLIYAGFSYKALAPEHMRHHARPGTADDPDFHAPNPHSFAAWYFGFFRHYFGLREFGVLTVILAVYVLLLGAPIGNLLLYWAVPALLSSLQLFYFGTYRTHRPVEGDAFVDEHHARTVDLPPLLSLLTCFHFGYHLEHHHHPHEPWWRLPAVRRAVLAREQMSDEVS
ncbi:fatty acid desaturase [Pyruvatibacter sp.]|uniref:fatty acid desaturase n=1 Tax=Pyruvatibacter sp. TaxID=1981328 RepID=UPI0032EFDF04